MKTAYMKEDAINGALIAPLDSFTPTSRLPARAAELFRAHEQMIYRRADYFFSRLLVVQWLAGIAVALWISPRTWIGQASEVHPHIWVAIFFGGVVSALPVFFCAHAAGRALDQAHHRRRTDAHISVTHPPQWRPHRDAFSCFWLARFSRVLS